MHTDILNLYLRYELRDVNIASDDVVYLAGLKA